jgi:hypothetical protein
MHARTPGHVTIKGMQLPSTCLYITSFLSTPIRAPNPSASPAAGGSSSLQANWTPTESSFSAAATAAGGSALEQINAYQDQQQMLRDQQQAQQKPLKIAGEISSGISRLGRAAGPTVTSLAYSVSSAVSHAAQPFSKSVSAATHATVNATISAASATMAAVRRAQQPTTSGMDSEDEAELAAVAGQFMPVFTTPQSDWLVCDDPASNTRCALGASWLLSGACWCAATVVVVLAGVLPQL